MKRHTFSALLMAGVLTGCTSAAHHDTDPARHVVTLEKQPFSVVPQGPNAWRVWGGRRWVLGDDDQARETQRALQRQAIELVSGCTIVDETPHDDPRGLSATVDCPSLPKQTFTAP